MKLSIIHISDIHVKAENSTLINESKKIAECAFAEYRDSDHCLIAVTGDVAHGGMKEEYLIAEIFFSQLKKILYKEKEIPIDIIIVPGNHDCRLVPENTIRNTIVQSIQADGSKADDESIVKLCVSVQSDFFEFRNKLYDGKKLLSDFLWDEIEISIGSKNIRLSLINASWMSTLHEKQGGLVFPIKKFDEILSGKFDHRFTFIHHPMNWYCQDTYHDFRRVIQQNSSMVFSGHEHTGLASDVKTSNDGSTLYFEGKALDPHSIESDAGFSTLLIDLEAGDINQHSYSKTKSGYSKDNGGNVELSLSQKATINSISDGFLVCLKDPGVNLTLPEKESLVISDIYISPEVECQASRKTILFDSIELRKKKIYLTGDEQTGKTKTLHGAFSKLHDQGFCPVYVDAKNIKRFTRDGIKKAIDRAEEEQYSSVNSLLLEGKENRAILIDNYEEIVAIRKGLDSIFGYIDENFETIIISCDELFSSTMSSSGRFEDHFSDYEGYILKDFGCNLRYKLIKKWHSYDHSLTVQEYEEKVHSSEKTITTVLGKNLIPSRPLYLLTLLQSSSSQGREELHNSGMSYYYQYLITKSLDEVGVGRGNYDEIFNYLSNLAWFYRGQDCDSLDEQELSRFNFEFSKKFTTINLDKQLDIFIKSKILTVISGQYSFMYPYIKYFFLGKYFADHMDDVEITSIINQCCEDLGTRENSNLVLFLTHHKNSDWVVDNISKNLNKCFEKFNPIEFGDDTSYLNDIVGSVSEIVISELDVEGNQTKQREMTEEMSDEPADEQLSKNSEGYNEATSDLFRLLRTSDVLGQILKNYYGSITRSKKNTYLIQSMNAPLRLLGFVINEIVSGPENMANKIEQQLLKRDVTLTKSEVNDISTRFISEFIGNLCTGLVAKTAESIGSEKLKEEIGEVVAENGSNSFKLIEAAISLITPGSLPIGKLKKLAQNLELNPLAFIVLQNLALYHIHMFHTPDREKQALGALVKINLQAIQSPAKIEKNKN